MSHVISTEKGGIYDIDTIDGCYKYMCCELGLSSYHLSMVAKLYEAVLDNRWIKIDPADKDTLPEYGELRLLKIPHHNPDKRRVIGKLDEAHGWLSPDCGVIRQPTHHAPLLAGPEEGE